MMRKSQILLAASLCMPLLSLSLASAATVEPVGEDRIVFSGEIVEGDADRLTRALARSHDKGHGTLVLLNSVGGDASEGIKAGVAISDAHANVVVGENMVCASACFFLFISGEKKGVGFGARVGVHSARQMGEDKETPNSAMVSVIIARLYEKLELPPKVIAKSVTTPPDQIYWLSEADMRDMNVVIISAFNAQQPSPSPQPSEGRSASVPQSRQPQVSSHFFVEGAYIGGNVVPNSTTYQDYSCKSSTQYPSAVWCVNVRMEGVARISRTVLHSLDGSVFYVNKEIVPAYFNGSDISNEINRLSKKYGEKPNIVRSRHQDDYPDAIIAVWGNIALHPLSPADLRKLARGKNPKMGVLVDFLGDFHASARAGYPVYFLTGHSGFVWIASVGQNGVGKLRFFAADPAMMGTPISETMH